MNKQQIEAAADAYAVNECDAYTNDYNGFVAGAEWMQNALNSSPQKPNRCFFVSFKHAQGFGNVSVVSTNGSYLNLKVLVRQLLQHDGMVAPVTVLNIIELTEDDYNHFNADVNET
jgi:hypothetical protein